MKRVVFAVVASAVLLQPSSSTVRAQSASLSFFQHYFLTGDYVVEGVGLPGGSGGMVGGDIRVNSVPAGVDIVAAFLYWQVKGPAASAQAGAEDAMFRGIPLATAEGGFGKPVGVAPGDDGDPSVPSDAARRTYTYRADVLRFLDVDPATGKHAANGVHRVELLDNFEITPVGASLVLVYRDPRLPLSAIVLYDGAVQMRPGAGAVTVAGIDDPDTQAKVTVIAGGGDAGRGEFLTYNGARVATNPLAGAQGPRWDNPTVALTADPTKPQITTGLDYAGVAAPDTMTWSAVVYRSTVHDTDGDGLLDAWESATPPADPYGRPRPNLAAMGASPLQPDVFIEVGYFTAAQPTTYGGVLKPAHSHLPTHEALKLVGDMFAAAPTGRVNVHFDVGAAYPAGAADPYIIRGAGLARGGEAIAESVTVCAPAAGAPVWECQFAGHPGTVGWKSGYRFLRDEVKNPPVVPPGQDDPCDLAGNTCERRFDETRRGIFRYALFAHALGLPKSELACLDGAGQPVADVNDQCAVAPNPEFHTPRTNTGIADFPGADILVTLGGFDDANALPVGTPFMQASTLAHEFGHTAERRHGGGALEPNCKPTYFSAMNYLYQLRGLLDDTGLPHLDFSRAFTGQVDETALADGSLQDMPYRLGYYAPLAGSYLAGRTTAARTHCDGSPLLTAPNGSLIEPPMVRIDGRTAAGPVDWNADGDALDTAAFGQDANFNGRLDGVGNPPFPPLAGADDWSTLRLDQLGAARNVGGLFPLPGSNRFGVGPLSLAVGKGDLGKGDLGKGDLGKGDLGKGDLGKGDLGKGDLGKGDLGKGDLGKGDLGGGDLFLGDPNNPGGELDADTARDLARTPPNQFQACVVGAGNCAAPGAALHDVVARWTLPNVGGVAQYALYRVAGAGVTPGQAWTLVAQVPAPLGQTAFTAIDTTELVGGASYTYFAVAAYTDGVLSDPSNLVTVAAVNDPPVAVDDDYSVNENTTLSVAAPGVLANDRDPDSSGALQAQLVTGAQHGAVTLAPNGAFVYTPAANYSGWDSFYYRAVSGGAQSNPAEVSVLVVAGNKPPAAFDIPDVTIDENGTGGPLRFTIVDERPATVTLTAVSNNTELLPVSRIVFGGSGAARTVTVTPRANTSGKAVVTVTATDDRGATARDTFTVTVRDAASYKFVGELNAPPPARTTFEAGRTIPMKWYFADGHRAVASSHLTHTVTIRGPKPNGGTVTIVDNGADKSLFRYQANDKLWSFNLQTKRDGRPWPAGEYEVVITTSDARFKASPPITLKLVR